MRQLYKDELALSQGNWYIRDTRIPASDPRKMSDVEKERIDTAIKSLIDYLNSNNIEIDKLVITSRKDVTMFTGGSQSINLVICIDQKKDSNCTSFQLVKILEGALPVIRTNTVEVKVNHWEGFFINKNNRPEQVSQEIQTLPEPERVSEIPRPPVVSHTPPPPVIAYQMYYGSHSELAGTPIPGIFEVRIGSGASNRGFSIERFETMEYGKDYVSDLPLEELRKIMYAKEAWYIEQEQIAELREQEQNQRNNNTTPARSNNIFNKIFRN